MTTSNIALSKLTVSAQNVRVVAPDKTAHKRLMASIVSQGILQNLVVVPAQKERFEVIAGGRRLLATPGVAVLGQCPPQKKEPRGFLEWS